MSDITSCCCCWEDRRQEPLVFLQCCKYQLLSPGLLAGWLLSLHWAHWKFPLLFKQISSLDTNIPMLRLLLLQGFNMNIIVFNRLKAKHEEREGNILLSLSAITSLASLDFNPSRFFREIFSKTPINKLDSLDFRLLINIWYFSTDPCLRTSLRSVEACPPCSPTTMRNRHRTTSCLLHVSNFPLRDILRPCGARENIYIEFI